MKERIQIVADTLLAQRAFVEERMKRCDPNGFDPYKNFCDGEIAGLEFALSLMTSLLRE